MSYFDLLKPKTERTLHHLSKWSCKSINWFFSVCKNYVDTSCSSSSLIHSSSKSNTDSLRQRRGLRAEKNWLGWLFTLISISKSFNFICALLCVAIPSRASIKDSTKAPWFELYKKIGCWIKLHENGTIIVTCLPTQAVVSVLPSLSCCTQIDSKLNIAMFLRNFWSMEWGILNESSLSNSVCRSWYTFFGKTCLNLYLQVVKCCSRLPASLMMWSHDGQR